MDYPSALIHGGNEIALALLLELKWRMLPSVIGCPINVWFGCHRASRTDGANLLLQTDLSPLASKRLAESIPRRERSLQLQNDRAFRDGRCSDASIASVLFYEISRHFHTLVATSLILKH